MEGPLDFVMLVLGIPVEDEGHMRRREAEDILNVTERPSKWLLLKVHPDKHMNRYEAATAAATRVNQAIAVMAEIPEEVD